MFDTTSMKEVRKQQCFISISAYIIKTGTTNKLVQGKNTHKRKMSKVGVHYYLE